MSAGVASGRGTRWVAGLDGCPAGWIAVLFAPSGSHAPRSVLLPSIDAIADLPEQPLVIAVDMPIGLPEHVGTGGRGCDVAARKVIGARQSSIFAVPARAAVMEEDYGRACEVAVAHSSPPRKVSKQCFHLFPKIREVDAWIAEHGHDRIFECHPEVAFWALNGQSPLSEPKKVKSRLYEPGLALRRKLLTAAGVEPAFLANLPWKRREAGPDDLLDACAVAWSAARILRGQALSFPDTPMTDGLGIPMAIRA